MQPIYFVKFPNNQLYAPGIFDFWSGFGSTVMSNGPIIQFIYNYLVSLPQKTLFIGQKADGHYPIPDHIQALAKNEGAVIIASVVAAVEQLPHFFYCVASDDFFVNPVYDVFAPHHIPWEQKEKILFWRGGVSGDKWRINMVNRCLTVPQTDVKFVDQYSRVECNPTLTPQLFANKVDVVSQLRYKALLYIDGNSSASNATWIFATGSVPVFVSINEFWFKKFLTPWVHYVPVKWDLSDLEEILQWIWDHDDEAHKIAENALEISRTILSCEHQREYLKREINHLIDEHIQNTKE